MRRWLARLVFATSLRGTWRWGALGLGVAVIGYSGPAGGAAGYLGYSAVARPEVAAGARRAVPLYPGDADVGSKINAAIRACPQTGCEILLPAGFYRLASTIVVNRPVWLVGAGAAATSLHYVGSGDAVVVEAGYPAPFLSGGLRDLTIAGGSHPGSAGVHQVDTIGFTYDDVGVRDFGGEGAAGIWMDNRPTSFCGTCFTPYSERTAFFRVSLFRNNIGILWTNNGGNESFEYTWIEATHFQVEGGQRGMVLAGHVGLQHSDVEAMANVWDPGKSAILFDLVGGAAWYQGHVMITGEQTRGVAGVGFRIDRTSYFEGRGTVELAGLPNRVAPGGKYIHLFSGPGGELGDGEGALGARSSALVYEASKEISGAHFVVGHVFLLGGEARVGLSPEERFRVPASVVCSSGDRTAPAPVMVTPEGGSSILVVGKGGDWVDYQCVGR